MVQYSNSAKTCHQSEKDGTILKQGKTCHQSEKDGTILKQCQNLSTLETKPATSQRRQQKSEPNPVRKRWYNSQTEQPANSQKTDGTILKQCQNLPTVRKRWYNTQTDPKRVTSQKNMVQYSNRAKPVTSQKKMAQYSNRAKPVTIKRWDNTQTDPKRVTSQKNMVQYSNRAKPVTSKKKMVQYSNRAKTCHQSEKDGTILKQRKASHWSEYSNTVVFSNRPKLATSEETKQYSNRAKSQEKDGKILKQYRKSQNLPPVRKI